MKKIMSMVMLLIVVALVVVGCQKGVDKTVQGETTVKEETVVQTESAVQEDQEISDNLNDLSDLDTITSDIEADVNVDDLDALVN